MIDDAVVPGDVASLVKLYINNVTSPKLLNLDIISLVFALSPTI